MTIIALLALLHTSTPACHVQTNPVTQITIMTCGGRVVSRSDRQGNTRTYNTDGTISVTIAGRMVRL